MTPGLAGFVVGGDEKTWDDVLDGVLAALAGAFATMPDQGGGSQRRTWLDTFDWRLYRAGLCLEYVTAHRSGELVLSGTNGQLSEASRNGAGGAGGHQLSQPVAGWRATRPCLWYNLPDGPVTDQVAGLVEPRALLPAVTVASSTAVTRLLNSDGKTVARLLIERPVIGDRALPPRITVAEVRGYAGQARRAARIIALSPGIEPTAASSPEGHLLDDALRAVGRRAGDYSNKIDARITADMPAPVAVAAILLVLLDAITVNVDGVLRDTDSEFLHDLRVAVRRTRAAIKLMGDVLGLPDADYDRFAAEFKWVGDLTTPVRDLDVHLLGYGAMASGLRAAKEDDLVPFRVFLEERRVRELRVLTRGLRSPRFTQLMDEWRGVLTGIAGSERRGKRGGRARSVPKGEALTAGTLATARTRQAFRKVSQRGAAITTDSPPESLHDLRKRAKELRYALEFFAPLHDKAAYGAVLGDLKRLQDCLGEFQDNEVQIDEIRALADAMLTAGAAPAGTLLAMGELTAGLAAGQQAARDAFEKRFASFAGLEGQRRMAVLLGGSSTA